MPDTLAMVPAKEGITLTSIQAVITDELAHFRAYFREEVRAHPGLLDTLLQYILRRKGKQVRPTLVLLTAKACGGVTETSYRAAALVELLHTATLIHDDVVDQAAKRRGAFSINALWGNKVSVLLGDYLLSRGLLLALRHNEYDQLHALSESVRRMSEGELLQAHKARRLDIDEPTYLEIISHKTASLLSACTMCGARSAGADNETIDNLEKVGEYLGLAFQIRDDLFDYTGSRIGKPVGIDLESRQLTLPLIHALSQAETAQKRKVLRIIRKSRRSREERRHVLSFVKETGGITYATQRMITYVTEAQQRLARLDPSPAREALNQLAAFVATRKK